MKNVLVIDGAENCVYDIFQASDDDFAFVFPDGTDIAFAEDILTLPDQDRAESVFSRLWSARVPKAQALGIHGVLFFELEHKRRFYPTRKDEEAVNPDGTKLRG